MCILNISVEKDATPDNAHCDVINVMEIKQAVSCVNSAELPVVLIVKNYGVNMEKISQIIGSVDM